MFRLALILFGADALIKRWKVFFFAGLLTVGAAAMLLVDLVDGVANVTTWVLGLFLLLQGLSEIAVGASHTGSRRRFEMLRGAAMVALASLVLDFPWDNALTAGVIFAAAFLFNGVLRIASSLLVRYPRWRVSNLIGWGYLVMALLLVTEWPLRPEMNVPFCLGLALLGAGYVLVRGAWHLRRLPRGSRLAAVEIYHRRRVTAAASPAAAQLPPVTGHASAMVVHVWTAAGLADERIRMPLIDRYIFAMSRKGSVTTGHVALSCGDDLYISHHPRVRLNITQQNVMGQVRASSNNDHPGMWLPSYAQEADSTRPATFNIRFRVFSQPHLQDFWAQYSKDDTYNLTSRNCSVAVTEAIDAAVEGVFADKPFWRTLLRLAVHPDMWLAGSVRVRAESIAWTPGLALDYAGALRRITHPRHDLKMHLARWWKARRRH
ncbi:MAG: protease [Pseudomonadota bacterium]